jgi:hypothetical protein
VKLFNDALIAACDRLDGLADGIVSNYAGCIQRQHSPGVP